MKVAYVLGRFPTVTETFVMNEIIGVIKNGIDVEIYSIFYPNLNVLHPEIVENQLLKKTYYFRLRNILKLRSIIGFVKKWLNLSGFDFQTRSTLAYLAQLAQERGCRHIHTHFVPHHAETISNLTGIPYSFTAHCFEEKSMSKEAKQDLKRRLENAAFVVPTSSFSKKGFVSMVDPRYHGKIQIIRTGININKFKSHKKKKGPFTLISVGVGYFPSKGIKYLIEALALIKKDFVFKTLLVGDGPERKRLEILSRESGLEDRITFLGNISTDAVFENLKNSDCFVLPCIVTGDEKMDGLPISLMEAMAVELPVISTPVAGIPDLVVHMKTGLLVPQKDSRALADVILALHHNPELCKELGFRARQKVVQEFNAERTGKEMMRLFTNKCI